MDRLLEGIGARSAPRERANQRVLELESTARERDDWTHTLSSTQNSNTNAVYVPNGSATAANVLATNNSDLTGGFGFASFGMNGANAETTTLGVGGDPDPPHKVIIGPTLSVTHKATGMQVLNAVEDIGPASTRITGATNVGGANALALAASAQNFETYCTAGQIAAVAGGPVETVLRPLWGEFSALIADLQAKKVI